MRVRLVFLLSLALVWNSWGSFVITPESLQAQSRLTLNQQLLELHQAFRPQYEAFLAVGVLWFPLATQTQFASPYGEHQGFGFRQKAAFLWQNPVGAGSQRAGLAWWGERHGFDAEDFLLVPAYQNVATVRSVHSLALLWSHIGFDLSSAVGLQWSHPEKISPWVGAESDSLRYFAALSWTYVGAQVVFKGAQWQQLNVYSDLAQRSVRGQDSSGWRTYLPDLHLLWSGVDRWDSRVGWRQNLYEQKTFIDARWWFNNPHRWDATLQWYVDASQLVGLELSWLQKSATESWWGLGVEMPFVRIAYNLPRDFQGFFQSKSTVMVELQLNIGSNVKKEFFALNAAQGAPMETEVKSKPAAVVDADRSLEGK